jgi:phosphomannomutase
MSIAYVFDVDGTLTPSRVRMNEEFRQEFLAFQETNNTYLVTGSDYPKTLEQVGEEVISKAKLVFNCCGNEVRTANHLSLIHI